MKHLPLLVALIAVPTARAAVAAEPPPVAPGLAVIEDLGRINGIALACAQPALVSRSRNAVINGAPKTRAIGEAFENATNAAFLKQGQGLTCPDGPTLAGQLEGAEARLKHAFPPGQ